MGSKGQPGDGRPSRAVQVLRLLPPIGIIVGAAGFTSLAGAQAAHASSPVVMAMGAMIPFGVLVLLVSVPLVLAFGGETIDPGTDGEDGGGGPPPPPDDPDPEPPWWPSFEADLQGYREELRRRDRVPVG